MQPLTGTLFLSVLLLFITLSSCNFTRPTYVITAPRKLSTRLNMTFTICILEGSQSPVTITARISDKGQNITSATDTFHPGSIGKLVLPTEGLPENRYNLVVEGHGDQNLLFSESSSAEIIPERVSALIQTDKAMYKPGQTVKIRAICIYTDLKPYLGKINILIYNPQGSVIQQWTDLETTLGVVSKEFLLSPNALQGSWEIRVTFNEVIQKKTFSVAEYVLPRFEVLINTSSVYFILDQMSLTGSITGRYLYGKPVKGNVTIILSLPYFSQTLNKTFEIIGTADFAFLFSELREFILGVYAPYLDFDGIPFSNQTMKAYILEKSALLIGYWKHQVMLKAVVTEYHTGVVQSATTNITLSFRKYYLAVLDHMKILKPSMNFTAYVQVKRNDQQKISPQDRQNRLTVMVSQAQNIPGSKETLMRTLQTFNFSVPENGLVQVQFPLLPHVVSLWAEVTFEDASAGLNVRQTYRTPAIFLHLQSSTVKVGTPFEFSIESFELPIEFTYQVISKGQMVAIGKSNLTQVQLTPDISWAPAAHLIVYFIKYYLMVSDEILLNVEGIFTNKVSLSWSTEQAKPADSVSLNVSTNEVNSLVGILVVDKSAQLLKGGNDITEELVLQTLINTAEDNTGFPYSHNVFQMSGLIILTDARIPLTESLYPVLYNADPEFKLESFADVEEEEEPEDQRVRTYFPETWLWLDMLTGLNSEISIQRTVPDSLTTWTASAFAISKNQGLQLATVPAQLEVFKFFFLELNLPYSVTRGEQLILEVNIFNYLEQTLEVQVTVELGDFFEFTTGPSEDMALNSQSGSVRTQEAHVFYFPVTPKALGKVPITVKARTAVAFDAVTKHILVKAEGIQQSFSKAHLIVVEDNNQLWTKEVQFNFPLNVVEGSERAYVTVIGDILGPSINGLENLLQMPYGCGEQNMIMFAPNIYIMQYLASVNQVTEEIKEKAFEYMVQGYQRELTYQRTDGSFSAFGNSDSSGSTWLSAFVLRCFLQAREFIYIDSNVVDRVTSWIIKYQNKSGEFMEPGRVIHTELQGGQNGPITLTAYVLTALLEDPKIKVTVLAQVSSAVSYLEGKFRDGIHSNYTLCLTTYALTLAKSKLAKEALDELNRRADQQDGVKYWSSPVNRPSRWMQGVLSSDIEVAAYALMSYLRQSRLLEGIPVMKWLSQRRNHLGGFSSTQDTVVALQALSQFTAENIAPSTDLEVSISGSGLLDPATLTISSTNMFVLQTVELGIEQPLMVTVTAKGQGMAIFQLNVLFNLESNVLAIEKRSVESEEAFDLDITVSDNILDLNHLSLMICTRFRGDGNHSITGMVLMEVGMLSGFIPETDSIHTSDVIKKVEFTNGNVNLYFDSLNETEVCVTIPVIRDSKVANAQDAVVSIFDYYEPGQKAVKTYNSEVMSRTDFCTLCSSDCEACHPTFSLPFTAAASTPARGRQVALLLCLVSIYLGLT
ncbi:CD109 antigen isoform X1 [Hypanus sabinus]|uniref:CD109 antigen isoform X1 n=2 Tax=Hypanus sabinus TaxID=79690 RepID=UPI0028C3E591|nr:CD109 antigen isoform X1 [Hypanus sabinus]